MATRSLLGPLTTTFTAPSACTALALDTSNIKGATVALYQAQGCRSSTTLQDTSTCWPSAAVRAPGPPFNGWGFYSPGLICPAGYSTACSATVSSDGSQQGSFNFQFPLAVSEMAAGCCPSGYQCTSVDTGQTCLSLATTGSYDVGVCDGSSIGSTTSLPIPSAWTVATTTAVSITSASLFAPMIQINWKNSDNSTSPTSTSTTIPSVTSAISSASPSADSGLSTGAKIGIGVGVGLGGLLLFAAIGMLVLRKRKKSGPMDMSSAEPKRTPVEAGGRALKSELPAQYLGHELESRNALPVQKEPVELPGSEGPEERQT